MGLEKSEKMTSKEVEIEVVLSQMAPEHFKNPHWPLLPVNLSWKGSAYQSQISEARMQKMIHK